MADEVDEALAKTAPTLPGMEGAMDEATEAQLRSEVARRVFEARQDAGPWLDDYIDLLDEGWSWRQAVYILWASLPKQWRQPASQWELATEILGLTSDRVIRDWKARHPALEQRVAELAASALMKARPDVFGALIDSATMPDYKHHQDRKLFLEMTGDYTPRQDVRMRGIVDEADLEAADAEELRALAELPVNVKREDVKRDDATSNE